MGMNILVLGIGQSLRGDDGVGPEAVRLWRTSHPETANKVRVEVQELPGLDLLTLLEGMNAAVIVDAVMGSGPEGMLLRLTEDELTAFQQDGRSAHGWGVAETLQMRSALGGEGSKCKVILIGVTGRRFELGSGPSEAVLEGVKRAAEMIEMEISRWLSED